MPKHKAFYVQTILWQTLAISQIEFQTVAIKQISAIKQVM